MSRRLALLAVGFFVWLLFCVASATPQGQSAPPSSPPTSSTVSIVGSVVDAMLVPLAGATVTLERGDRTVARATSDATGAFKFSNIPPGDYRVRAEHAGFPVFSRDVHVGRDQATIRLPLVLARATDKLTAPVVPQAPPAPAPMPSPAAETGRRGAAGGRGSSAAPIGSPVTQGGVQSLYSAIAPIPQPGIGAPYWPPPSNESYTHVDANRFQSTHDHPLSTFGADVDTASYTNIRRFLSIGQLPPTDAVRVEELVNYFHFAYPEPRDGRPIALTSEIGDCPWAPTHKLVLIGARAKAPAAREGEGRNIVLLIDVSGSMAPPERLPLIKTALSMFADTLRPDDRLAIVTYAGTSGVALPSTPARNRVLIQGAIAGLNAGGSTNGAQGLIMAYRTALESFVPGGVNRVILATDGDFNVGIVNHTDLLHLIERERESGVFLSVFGVGTGNLKDSTMEMLADRGNGQYAYLDSLQEARRVLIREGDATLATVAKDVKFQVEFNPNLVAGWKLIGYEDRLLRAPDFNDDRKDGGEMGSGQTVTVLYEVIPVGAADGGHVESIDRPSVDPLRYQTQAPMPPTPPPSNVAAHSGEWLTVKARYKAPEGEQSALITQSLRSGARVQHLPLASAVAEFGLLLRSHAQNAEQWNALSRRVAELNVPAPLVADIASFKELVAIAQGLERVR